MKKWLTDYHQSRPGLKVLQQSIDEFIIAHEAKLEQERKEKEARLTEGGWVLVGHHKGRKKTTDSESGTTVGSVSQAAVEDKLANTKSKEVSDFYRFQKREAQRNDKEARSNGSGTGWDGKNGSCDPPLPSPEVDEYPSKPTRIVVLKPSPRKSQDIKTVASPSPSSPRILLGDDFL
ncbi:hypothetical protein V6N13_136958 [Hibiscus sabdariffa]|uniref:Ribosomal RNA-processing protein 7 C-terminal domain-containing protein n=1 Tax=Hibiscus sabdariffa TaxID=183260 RepID=A0ABR2DMH9_9ROSI